MEPDLRTLRLRGIDEIRTRVPFDAYVFVLTDPQTAVGADPLADVPCLPELARLVRLKYLTEVNRWTTLAAGGSVARSLGGDPARSLVWREVQSRYGVADVASVVFADRYGCWGFLDLWRGLAFSDREVDLLARLAPDLCEALRQGQAATFAAPALAQPRDLGPVVVLLDDELAVVGQTEAALDWLRALLPRAGQPPIPASVYNVAAQLLAREQGVDNGQPMARVHLADGFWITVRAARIASPVGAPGTATVAVTLEEASPVERLEVFGRAHGLTPREVEVLGLLANGDDNRALARRLHVSEHTVSDHLKALFAKTSARSRAQLISRALGAQVSR